jgi:hypothetical protein
MLAANANMQTNFSTPAPHSLTASSITSGVSRVREPFLHNSKSSRSVPMSQTPPWKATTMQPFAETMRVKCRRRWEEFVI